jgi:hypothetical protein
MEGEPTIEVPIGRECEEPIRVGHLHFDNFAWKQRMDRIEQHLYKICKEDGWWFEWYCPKCEMKKGEDDKIEDEQKKEVAKWSM